MTHDSQMETLPADSASQPFVGRWNELVSTTNWEKGRIIAEWRDALVSAGAAVSEYADEAWASRVGGVTAQHVGRLRRVFQRFNDVREQYARLSWSHFQAAVEWPDPEMWLEGAMHNDWSVASMRRTRWETLGGAEELRPETQEIVATELDEDFVAESDETSEGVLGDSTRRSGDPDGETGPLREGPDFGEDAADEEMPETDFHDASVGDSSSGAERVRAFADLPPLPDDLSDAVEQFKLAILRHKTNNWRDVSCTDVIAALEALKTLAIS